ncbi:chromatin modifying protein 2B protein [Entophlyctis helioformis]|nr:chromatin modifying protein 2B protein [Entophlyctis helioformis]
MDKLASLFKAPDPKEELRKQQRALKAETRSLDRDRASLARQQTQLEADIQRAAKQGNMAQAKTLARQLVRLREQQSKNVAVKAHISGIAVRAQTNQSQIAVAAALGGASKVMAASNKQMDVAKMQQTLQGFAQESMKMEMTDEMSACVVWCGVVWCWLMPSAGTRGSVLTRRTVNDVLDGVLDGSDDEEESNDIMNQVLDEIGISVSQQMASAPATALPSTAGPSRVSTRDDQELQARFAALSK